MCRLQDEIADAIVSSGSATEELQGLLANTLAGITSPRDGLDSFDDWLTGVDDESDADSSDGDSSVGQSLTSASESGSSSGSNSSSTDEGSLGKDGAEVGDSDVEGATGGAAKKPGVHARRVRKPKTLLSRLVTQSRGADAGSGSGGSDQRSETGSSGGGSDAGALDSGDALSQASVGSAATVGPTLDAAASGSSLQRGSSGHGLDSSGAAAPQGAHASSGARPGAGSGPQAGAHGDSTVSDARGGKKEGRQETRLRRRKPKRFHVKPSRRAEAGHRVAGEAPSPGVAEPGGVLGGRRSPRQLQSMARRQQLQHQQQHHGLVGTGAEEGAWRYDERAGTWVLVGGYTDCLVDDATCCRLDGCDAFGGSPNMGYFASDRDHSRPIGTNWLASCTNWLASCAEPAAQKGRPLERDSFVAGTGWRRVGAADKELSEADKKMLMKHGAYTGTGDAHILRGSRSGTWAAASGALRHSGACPYLLRYTSGNTAGAQLFVCSRQYQRLLFAASH